MFHLSPWIYQHLLVESATPIQLDLLVRFCISFASRGWHVGLGLWSHERLNETKLGSTSSPVTRPTPNWRNRLESLPESCGEFVREWRVKSPTLVGEASSQPHLVVVIRSGTTSCSHPTWWWGGRKLTSVDKYFLLMSKTFLFE